MTTNQLILRKWKTSDAQELYKYASDPDIGNNCGWPPHHSVEESLSCIRNVLSVPETYAIVLRETDKPIGCIGLKNPAAICASVYPKSMELGFWIGAEYQGRGLIVEAASAVLEYAFCKLRLSCVWCGYYTGNERSRRAQEKIGFLPHHSESKVPTAIGEYRDIHYSCMTLEDWIVGQLQSSADEQYKEFNARLNPDISADSIIGVRLPVLRKLAKRIGPGSPWLNQLPHRYFEQDLLHSILVSMDKDTDICMEHLRSFLPYVNNWAVCDTLSPKCFVDGDKKIFDFAKSLILSDQPFKIRYGFVLLLRHFTKESFRARHMDMIKKTAYNHYYVRMAIAWYLAEAMIEHFDDVHYFLQHECPDKTIKSMAIRKGIESFRVSDEHKLSLKQLRTGTSPAS